MTTMPRDRDFKKVVRRRMAKTGESYTAARAQLVDAPPPATPSGMYPFERFHENARHVLATAQAEAQKAGVGLILPQHLLLGLLRVRQGIAARVLKALGVRAPALRALLKARGPQRVHHPAGRIIPATSTKRVIEQAFHQAQQGGSQLVGTEHLLLAIYGETDDPACQVLAELGATAERAAPLIAAPPPPRRLRGASPPKPMPHPAPTGGVASAIQRGRNAAEAEGAMLFRSDHLLSQLVGRDSPTPALVDLLRACGADLDELRRRLRPPRQVTRLEGQIWRLRHEEDSAVRRSEEERARELLAEEARLRERLAAALDSWNASWAKDASHLNGAPDLQSGL
jgi:ClpA/ClpB-like protein